MTASSVTKARNGVWTPSSQVLCVECDRRARLAEAFRPSAIDCTAVTRPDGHELGLCNSCRRPCWTRLDVALLQHVGFLTSDLDDSFKGALQQTGGMCCALVFTTDDREIVVTAMDGYFFIGEYNRIADDSNEEARIDAIRTWQSEAHYANDDLKPPTELGDLADQCARKVIEFVHNMDFSHVVIAAAIKSQVANFDDQRLHGDDEEEGDAGCGREIAFRCGVAGTADAIARTFEDNDENFDLQTFATACGLYVSKGRDLYSGTSPEEVTWEVQQPVFVAIGGGDESPVIWGIGLSIEEARADARLSNQQRARETRGEYPNWDAKGTAYVGLPEAVADEIWARVDGGVVDCAELGITVRCDRDGWIIDAFMKGAPVGALSSKKKAEELNVRDRQTGTRAVVEITDTGLMFRAAALDGASDMYADVRLS